MRDRPRRPFGEGILSDDEPVEVEAPAMKLLPCRPGVCQECAVDHPPEAPHNAQSLYYQYKFYGANGRWPTWADAVAHCDERTQGFWKAELVKLGAWTEPRPEEVAGNPRLTGDFARVQTTFDQARADYDRRNQTPE